MDGLSAFIAKGKIPERFYNPESKDKEGKADYNPVLFEVYKQKGEANVFPSELMIGFVQRTGINTGSYTNEQLEFAFICGFWNGLVDMVASIPHFASWIVKMIINEGTVRAEFVEGVIKLIEQCEFTPDDLAFAYVMPNGVGTEIGKCLIEVAGKYLIKKFKQDNACQNAATVGGMVFVVVMAILPFTDVAAFARVAEFLAMIDPAAMMLRSLGVATRIIYRGGRMLYSSGKYYLSVSLRKGGRIVAEFLDESLQLINAANCPRYQFAFAGETRWARFPPETELGGQLNGVRYMTDGTGKPILTENGEKVIVATRAGNEGKELIGIEEAKKPEVPEAEGTPHAPAVDEFSTINGRVNKPGGRMDKYKTYNEFEDVPSRYSSDPRFNKLAEDPAHGNEISEVTRQEAMAGLEAETQGLIKGPIERGPKEIEFYDGDGLPWDVKTPPSFGPKMPEKMKYKKVGEAIEKELVKKEDMVNPKTKKLEKRRVILDCTYMTETDHVGLWKWLNEHLDAEAMSRIIEVNVKL